MRDAAQQVLKEKRRAKWADLEPRLEDEYVKPMLEAEREVADAMKALLVFTANWTNKRDKLNGVLARADKLHSEFGEGHRTPVVWPGTGYAEIEVANNWRLKDCFAAMVASPGKRGWLHGLKPALREVLKMEHVGR